MYFASPPISNGAIQSIRLSNPKVSGNVFILCHVPLEKSAKLRIRVFTRSMNRVKTHVVALTEEQIDDVYTSYTGSRNRESMAGSITVARGKRDETRVVAL